ncbi:hypothetical protein G9A89_016297 [Geosiphon pyriformis]|nr:hypothetical protein G9A89_016297 [Geosiphon pyriformis]
MATQKGKTSGTTNHVLLVMNNYLIKECEMTFLDKEESINHLDRYPHNMDKIWHMANAKIEGATSNKILEIKNNPPEPVDIILISNPEAFLNIEIGPEEFHEHYQNLAPTREEQEQCLEEINT